MSDSPFQRYQEALSQGHLAVMRGKPREALARYEEAAAIADHRAAPHLSTGGLLLQLGRAADALAAFERAADRAPDDPAAQRGRADALAALGRHDEAAEARRRGEREAAPVEAEAAPAAAPAEGLDALLVDAERRAAADDRAGATALLVRAADGHLAAGASHAALDAAQRAVAIAPGDATAHLAMVRAYLVRGWQERAAERLALLERLVELEADPVAAEAVTAAVARHRAGATGTSPAGPATA